MALWLVDAAGLPKRGCINIVGWIGRGILLPYLSTVGSCFRCNITGHVIWMLGERDKADEVDTERCLRRTDFSRSASTEGTAVRSAPRPGPQIQCSSNAATRLFCNSVVEGSLVNNTDITCGYLQLLGHRPLMTLQDLAAGRSCLGV